MREKRTLSRRRFLKRAATAAGAAAALPAIVPSHVLGADAPSGKILMGAVGVGGMGYGDLGGFLGDGRIRVVGVCDVDRRHRERARGRVNKRYRNNDCKMYTDYRELIGRGDLDALMHALPDHWHALPVIAAAKAGCDIHGQKPFSRSIREGRAMCDAIHRYGRVWQTGSQQRSDGRFRFACELVRNGRIGKVHRVEVGLPTGGGGGNTAPKPVPDHLDWDMWLGPAPWRPYQGFGPHWSWRWILDYSGGQLTDWCGHHVDIAHWGLGYDRTGPVEIEGKGKYPTEGLFDAPTHYNFTCKYKTGVEINVTNNQINAQGAKWIGERGWVYVKRGRIDSEPKSLLREKIGAGEIRLYNSGGHKRNFVDCIFNRKETICPAEVGHRSISVGLLGEIAMLTGRKIRFDPDKEEIIGDPGASALLGRPYREPWQL
ncbi:MAG: Gfo/Idh/MocA family protein [Planctomycetota bacterium]|jgi:predicted dehydrogenase